MLLQRRTGTKTLRRFAAVVSAAALSGGLVAGCGSGSADQPSSAPVAATDGGVFPVTVEHAFGSTQIAKAPQRVVSVGYTDDQAILAFGIKPVGMVDQYPNPPGKTPTSTPSGPG